MKKIIGVCVLLAAVGMASLAAAQVATSTLPDPGTLPDSPFYFLKSWREGIQLFFTFGAEAKAKQYLHLAEVRLAEYQKMVEKGKQEIAQRTIEKYQDQLKRATDKLKELKTKGKDVKDLSLKVAEVKKHLQVFQENLAKKVKEAENTEEHDFITILSPRQNEVIMSPLAIRGVAKGGVTWEGNIFGEAKLKDGNEVELGKAPVRVAESSRLPAPAQFSTTLAFSTSSTEKGELEITELVGFDPLGTARYKNYTMEVNFKNFEIIRPSLAETTGQCSGGKSIFPAGGERLLIGTTQNIQWTAPPFTKTFLPWMGITLVNDKGIRSGIANWRTWMDFPGNSTSTVWHVEIPDSMLEVGKEYNNKYKLIFSEGHEGVTCAFESNYFEIVADNTSISSASSSDRFDDWQTYRNEQYGFEFMYPHGAVVAVKSPTGIELSTASHHYGIEIANIDNFKFKRDLGFVEQKISREISYDKMLGEFTVKSSAGEILKRENDLLYEEMNGLKILHVVYRVWPVDNSLFLIPLYTKNVVITIDVGDISLRDFDQILSTFKFISPSSAK